MPNHYHFLLKQETDITISKYIGVLFNAYVQAVNRQQRRSGTLFQGRFYHTLVTDESYLLTLCRYIHLNPVKAGLVKRPEQWLFSNYEAWTDLDNGAVPDDDVIRRYFPKPGEYRRFVCDRNGQSLSLKVDLKLRKVVVHPNHDNVSEPSEDCHHLEP